MRLRRLGFKIEVVMGRNCEKKSIVQESSEEATGPWCFFSKCGRIHKWSVVFFSIRHFFFKHIFWGSDIQLDYDCKIFGGWSRILRHSEMLVKADVWLRMMQPLAINRVTVSFLGRHLHPERFDQRWFSGWLARISWEQTIWQTAAPSPAGDCRVLMMISRILW